MNSVGKALNLKHEIPNEEKSERRNLKFEI